MLSGSGILTLKNLVYDKDGFLGRYIYDYEFTSSYLKNFYKCISVYAFQQTILNKYLSYSDTSVGTYQLMRYDRMYMNTAKKQCTFVISFYIQNQGNTSQLSSYTNSARIRFFNGGRFVGSEQQHSVISKTYINFNINVSSLNLSYSSNYKLYYDYNVRFVSSTTNANSGSVQPYVTITVHHTYMNDKVIIYKHEQPDSPYTFNNVASGGLINLHWPVKATSLTTSDRYISIPVLPTSGTVYINFEIRNVLTVSQYNDGGASTTSAAAEIGDWDI